MLDAIQDISLVIEILLIPMIEIALTAYLDVSHVLDIKLAMFVQSDGIWTCMGSEIVKDVFTDAEDAMMEVFALKQKVATTSTLIPGHQSDAMHHAQLVVQI